MSKAKTPKLVAYCHICKKRMKLIHFMIKDGRHRAVCKKCVAKLEKQGWKLDETRRY